jgi:hypothetical protein
MIINGNHIQQGIFTYKPGIQYELNDMIIDDDILYVVIDSYMGDERNTPDIAPQCKPYTEWHSIENELDTDESKVITASSLRKIINTMFQGLSLEGVISTLNTSDVNLNELKDTGAYLLNISNNLSLGSFLLTPSGSRVLLRVYKSSTDIIQEIINYKLPIFYYRYYADDKWSNWSCISNGDAEVLNQFTAVLNEYQNKVLEYANKIELLEDRSRIFYQEEWSSETPLVEIDDIEIAEDSIIQVGFMTNIGLEYPEVPTQEWITIDLSIKDTGIAISSNGSKIYFRVHYSNDNRSYLHLKVKYPSDMGIFKVLTLGKY